MIDTRDPACQHRDLYRADGGKWMNAAPKCPKCEKDIAEFAVQHIALGAKATTGPGFYAAVVCCPHCQVVISVVAEPNAIAADVVRRLLINKPTPGGTGGVGASRQTKPKTPPTTPA